jgi:cytoskeletal protein CcmA (bactofilin family)
MWTKQTVTEAPDLSPTPGRGPAVAPSNAIVNARPSTPTARNLACLGAGLKIKGQITGGEDLQIDGDVDGPISLEGQRLTVGPTGRLNSQVTAREVIVYGTVTGNLLTQERVEIKKDASVIGDIKTARLSIEDGAHFKGHIEIERGKKLSVADAELVGAIAGEAN